MAMLPSVRCVFLGLIISLFMLVALLQISNILVVPMAYEMQFAIPSTNAAALINTPQASDDAELANQSSKALHYPPDVRLPTVDCIGLFHQRNSSIENAKRYQQENEFLSTPDRHFIDVTADCDTFIATRGYVMKPVSDEEANFSISYTIMAYTEVEQVERLIRAIYRPQNYYCIHVDAKADADVKDGLSAISSCFPNVQLSSRSEVVDWGAWGVLEAELICMKDLLAYPKWRYHINLAAQEFPLKTNWELVRILKAFNGSNMMEGSKNRMSDHSYRFEKRYGPNFEVLGKKKPPPVDVTLNKGSFLIVARREFVQYAVYNETALRFLDWLKDTMIPDETYFCTLNHSPQLGIPGSYKGEGSTGENYPFLNHYIVWTGGPCHGKVVREVCIFSIGDLPRMFNRAEMFANKFHLSSDPVAYMCMEQLLYNKTRDEMTGRMEFSDTYYKQFEFTWNHV